MKFLVLTLFLSLVGPSFAAENVVPVEVELIEPGEAKNYEGQKVEVRGKCVEVLEKQGNVYLSFEKPYPKPPFYGIVLAQNFVNVNSAVALQGLAGKTCSIFGKVEIYKGRPGIVITSPDQIRIRVQGVPVKGRTGTVSKTDSN